MTHKLFVRFTSLCAAAVVAVTSAFSSSGFSEGMKVHAIGGTAVKYTELADSLVEPITEELFPVTDEVHSFEGLFLDENGGDIRKLTVPEVMKNVFEAEPTKVSDNNPERIYTFDLGNDWNLYYSMTWSYGSYMQNSIVLENSGADPGSVSVFYSDGYIKFAIQTPDYNNDNYGTPISLAELEKNHPGNNYPGNVIISEGKYIASPFELALVGILTRADLGFSESTAMDEGELAARATDYINYCNNEKISASAAAKAFESLLDKGKDARDIKVVDVLNEMANGKYTFKMSEDDDDVEFVVEGSGNTCRAKSWTENYGGLTYQEPITLNGFYKDTGKSIIFTAMPEMSGNTYMVSLTFESYQNGEQKAKFATRGNVNETQPLVNYSVFKENKEGAQVDCAVIAQIYGLLTFTK